MQFTRYTDTCNIFRQVGFFRFKVLPVGTRLDTVGGNLCSLVLVSEICLEKYGSPHRLSGFATEYIVMDDATYQFDGVDDTLVIPAVH